MTSAEYKHCCPGNSFSLYRTGMCPIKSGLSNLLSVLRGRHPVKTELNSARDHATQRGPFTSPQPSLPRVIFPSHSGVQTIRIIEFLNFGNFRIFSEYAKCIWKKPPPISASFLDKMDGLKKTSHATVHLRLPSFVSVCPSCSSYCVKLYTDFH